ncbi:hypothetical protein RJT34_07867 [Clitoria ternatea]|uniref:Uncharacterized protein n=1 Tax=Clitoria ternatea TaxID=43366 RepID=A0AAN9K712_CLITE
MLISGAHVCINWATEFKKSPAEESTGLSLNHILVLLGFLDTKEKSSKMVLSVRTQVEREEKVSLELSEEILQSMEVGMAFKDYNGRISSLDFHKASSYLVTASDDESIRLYDVTSGMQERLCMLVQGNESSCDLGTLIVNLEVIA